MDCLLYHLSFMYCILAHCYPWTLLRGEKLFFSKDSLSLSVFNKRLAAGLFIGRLTSSIRGF